MLEKRLSHSQLGGGGPLIDKHTLAAARQHIALLSSDWLGPSPNTEAPPGSERRKNTFAVKLHFWLVGDTIEAYEVGVHIGRWYD